MAKELYKHTIILQAYLWPNFSSLEAVPNLADAHKKVYYVLVKTCFIV